MGCVLRGNNRRHDGCSINGSRDRRTSNKKTSRAAGAAREPELIAIGRGLVRVGERETPIRERRRIVRHRFGFGALFLFCFCFVFCFCTRPSRLARREILPNINQHRDEEEEEDNEAGGTPGPRDGAGQGQGAAGEAVDVKTSGTGLGHANHDT